MREDYPKTHYEVLKGLQQMDTIFGCNFKRVMEGIKRYCGDDPSYDEVALTPILRDKLLNRLGAPAAEALFLNVYYHAYRLYATGENIYSISPSLCASLANTKLNISTYFLKSPFPEIYIQIPKGLYNIYDEGRAWPVSGFYVSLQELEGQPKLLRILVYAQDDKIKNAFGISEDTLFYFKLAIEEDNFEVVLKDLVENQISKNKSDLIAYGGINNAHLISTFFEFIFNTLLYITSKDPDIRKFLPPDYASAKSNLKSTAKIRKLDKKASKSNSYPILIVGKDFKSENNFEDIKSDGGVGKWRLNKKVKVSGHWKLQWYGSEKDGTRSAKPIFISGYTKGPDTAEIIGKRFRVGRA